MTDLYLMVSKPLDIPAKDCGSSLLLLQVKIQFVQPLFTHCGVYRSAENAKNTYEGVWKYPRSVCMWVLSPILHCLYIFCKYSYVSLWKSLYSHSWAKEKFPQKWFKFVSTSWFLLSVTRCKMLELGWSGVQVRLGLEGWRTPRYLWGDFSGVSI